MVTMWNNKGDNEWWQWMVIMNGDNDIYRWMVPMWMVTSDRVVRNK
jgi:hypothetical protein